MNGYKALVTGGCGFVGRHFVRWLLNRDYEVTVVDDLSTGLPPEKWPASLRIGGRRSRQVTFNKCDFRDFAKETNADYDLIVHLAAVVGGRMTIEGDPLSVATDLAIDATLFNWAVKAKPMPRKVIYFSSSAAYPICEQTPENNRPLHEDMIDFGSRLDVPDMTYGWSKLTGEFLARFASEKYGLDVAIYRPFSGYGEDQDFSYPFPSIIRRVANGESPMVVWGSGNQLRDFIYIEDVIEAVFATAYKLPSCKPLNLGSGEGISFRQLAGLACRVLGHRAEIVNDATKPEGVFARIADCSRMFQYYRPTTSLDRGIRIVYEHQLAEGLVEASAIGRRAGKLAA